MTPPSFRVQSRKIPTAPSAAQLVAVARLWRVLRLPQARPVPHGVVPRVVRIGGSP